MSNHQKFLKEKKYMSRIPYTSVVGSLMYAMLCTRPDICYVVGVVSWYQSNTEKEHWIAVKHIFKYFRRTKDYMLVYSSGSLETVGYTNLYSNETLILENLYLNMFLLLMVEPFVGEVSNKLVWLILILRLNMWLHLKP